MQYTRYTKAWFYDNLPAYPFIKAEENGQLRISSNINLICEATIGAISI